MLLVQLSISPTTLFGDLAWAGEHPLGAGTAGQHPDGEAIAGIAGTAQDGAGVAPGTVAGAAAGAILAGALITASTMASTRVTWLATTTLCGIPDLAAGVAAGAETTGVATTTTLHLAQHPLLVFAHLVPLQVAIVQTKVVG